MPKASHDSAPEIAHSREAFGCVTPEPHPDPVRTVRVLAGVVMYRSPVYTDGVKERSLQEPAFLVLTALAAGPQHGYGVIGDVERVTDGRVRLRAGTLYAALDRLTSDGLVEIEREEIVDGRLRRYYRLTEPGAARLATEAERLRRNAETATARLRLAGGSA